MRVTVIPAGRAPGPENAERGDWFKLMDEERELLYTGLAHLRHFRPNQAPEIAELMDKVKLQ